uniref:Dynein light chain n=1 Tax=Panagrolaimus sp. PS1159 TaxID=55785 RepID=A0AC35GVT1_9BILA
METSLYERIEIKETDMDSNMVKGCVDIVREAKKLFFLDKDVAAYIKDECEKKFGSTWHCVVGKTNLWKFKKQKKNH